MSSRCFLLNHPNLDESMIDIRRPVLMVFDEKLNLNVYYMYTLKQKYCHIPPLRIRNL